MTEVFRNTLFKIHEIYFSYINELELMSSGTFYLQRIVEERYYCCSYFQLMNSFLTASNKILPME